MRVSGFTSRAGVSSFSSSLKDKWLPRMGDQESVCRVSRLGSGAAIIQVACALMFATVTAFKTSFGGVGTATFLIAALIFGAIAIGIWRLSRVAAVAGLVLFLPEPIWWLLYDRSLKAFVSTIALTLFFALPFVNGVRGTFAYHRLLVEERSSRPGKDEEQAV